MVRQDQGTATKADPKYSGGNSATTPNTTAFLSVGEIDAATSWPSTTNQAVVDEAKAANRELPEEGGRNGSKIVKTRPHVRGPQAG